MSEGVDYCGPLKKIPKLFCLALLEKITKEWSVGSHIVMKSNTIVPDDIPPMVNRYKYIS